MTAHRGRAPWREHGCKLQLEFEGAVYQVINRGNYRSAIFREEGSKLAFLACLGEACEKAGWQVHAWCVMTNHFHLALETPRGNLVAGMQWLQSTFALRCNRYRRECGHLFQGRYKSLLVDPADALGPLCHYIQLNPVRAGITTVERLGDWPWSSFRWLMLPKERAEWYRPQASLDHAGGLADTPAGRRKFAEYLACLAENAPEQKRLRFDRMSKGWVLGTKEFKMELVDEHREAVAALEHGEPDLEEARTARLEARLGERLAAIGKSRADLARAPKSAAWKVALAAEMKATTTAINKWLGKALAMGSPCTVSQPADRYCKPSRSLLDASLKGRASRRATPRKLPVPRAGNRNVRRALVDVRQTGQSPHGGGMTTNFDYALERSLGSLFAREAVEFIERNKAASFSLTVTFKAPHILQVVKNAQLIQKEYDAAVAAGKILDVPKVPMARPGDADKFSAQFPGDSARADTVATIVALDEAVGRILDKIQAVGLERRTIIFFLGDNGGHPENRSNSLPLRDYKWSLYEGGIRVPFLASYPGVFPAGLSYDHPVSTLDFLPTVAALTGTKAPAQLDGVNLTPFLSGRQTTSPHDVLFFSTGGFGAVRQGKWKRVLSPNGTPALFDLASDFEEKRDHAAMDPNRFKELTAKWRSWRATMPAPVQPPGKKKQTSGAKSD